MEQQNLEKFTVPFLRNLIKEAMSKRGKRITNLGRTRKPILIDLIHKYKIEVVEKKAEEKTEEKVEENKKEKVKKNKKEKVVKKIKEKEEVQKLNIYHYIKLLHNEFTFIYNNKLPTKCVLIDSKTGEETITEDYLTEEPEYKFLASYFFHRYRDLRSEKSIGDFTKVFYPINNYLNIDSSLSTMTDISFIMIVITHLKDNY